MITINNAALSVTLLDPAADSDKNGSRYCHGGYIWQVYDNAGRPLLSGPHYPNPAPPPFDGQGIPEVFETPLGSDGATVGSDVCVIGVGLVRKSSGIEPFHPRNNPRVTLPCSWNIERGDDWAVMTATQRFGGKSITLKREIRLDGNRVESINTVNNTGLTDVCLRWFAHPFFPLNDNLSCGRINPPAILPENAGYYIDSDGTIRMKPDYPWEKGLFQLLEAQLEKLNFTIPHQVVGNVTVQTDYPVIRCALWANANTFSFEPFTQRAVKPAEETSWRISYIFGQRH